MSTFSNSRAASSCLPCANRHSPIWNCARAAVGPWCEAVTLRYSAIASSCLLWFSRAHPLPKPASNHTSPFGNFSLRGAGGLLTTPARCARQEPGRPGELAVAVGGQKLLEPFGRGPVVLLPELARRELVRHRLSE